MTGNQLKVRRTDARLTLEMAAQFAKVSWSTWQRWEKQARLSEAVETKAISAIQVAIDESLNGEI